MRRIGRIGSILAVEWNEIRHAALSYGGVGRVERTVAFARDHASATTWVRPLH